MHSNDTHVIYWDPSAEFTATTKGIVGAFFNDVAHDSGLPSNVFAVDAQYTDSSGGHAAYSSTFAGALDDADAYPTSGCTIPTKGADAGPPYTHCLTDTQLQSELTSFVGKEGLPRGPAQLYFLLLPHRVVTCFQAFGEECSNNVFCAYHSFIGAGSPNEVIYADIPFTLLDSTDAKGCQDDGHTAIQHPNGDTAGTDASTRFADVALKYVSHEWSEAITDPLVGNETAWVDEHGLEIGDKCNAVPTKAEEGEEGFDKSSFTPTLGGAASGGTLFNQAIGEGDYYLQSEWDNVARACLMRPLEVTSPALAHSTAVAGTPATFSGSAVDPYGEAQISWSFGDGAGATGASAAHTYAAPGTYTVQMTATDPLTGARAQTEQAVLVQDMPSASFTISGAARAGQAVSVDGSASRDPDGAITAYAWSFGDGVTATGATASHAFAKPGHYTVTLTVTDSAGLSASTSQLLAITPPASSAFASAASFNASSGAITIRFSSRDPGTLSWRGTFRNGRFGVFAAATRCRRALIRLAGRCLPARVLFTRGKRSLAGAGSVKVLLRPTAAGLRALRAAATHHKGVPVSLVLSFQSAWGGAPVAHARVVLVRLRRR
jgi:chitodextrinase